MRLLAVRLAVVAAAGAVSCTSSASGLDQPRQGESRPSRVTGYASLAAYLRAAGASVKPGGEVDQPFFPVTGKMLQVHGEDVQVFEFAAAAVADAQAARISPTGGTVGTTNVHWIGSPHFYKAGKLLVLYVGDNDKVLQALAAALGRQFAGR